MRYRTALALTALVTFAAPAAAQTDQAVTLLGTASVLPRASREPARPPITPANREAVTALARFVAAELGRDAEAPLETRTAVAAAAINFVFRFGDVRYEGGFSAADADAIREVHPRILSEGYFGPDGLSTRRLEWLEANGYALSIEAARRALLEHQDPSGGAVFWSDMFGAHEIDQVEREHVRTGYLPTSRGSIVFYTKKPQR